MKKNFILYLIFVAPFVCRGSNMGNSDYSLWQMTLGGKPAAMAGAFVASSCDLNGLLFNPASIAGIDNREILFTAVDDFLDFKSGYLAYTQQWLQGRQVGVVCQYRDYGEIQETDIVGETIGTASSNDLAISTSIAQSFSERFSVGVSFKFIQSNLVQYTSSAVGTDIGVLYRIPSEKLGVGVAINNLGFALKKFDQDDIRMPVLYRIGVSKQLAHLPLQVNFNVNRFHHDQSNLTGGIFWMMGGEFTLSDHLFLRLGYHSNGQNQKLGSTQDRAAGVSFGIGLSLKTYRFDFASSSNGVVGRINQFTIAIVL